MKTKTHKKSQLEIFLGTLTNQRLLDKETELTDKFNQFGNSEIEKGLIRKELQAVRWELKNRGVNF